MHFVLFHTGFVILSCGCLYKMYCKFVEYIVSFVSNTYNYVNDTIIINKYNNCF